MGDAQMSIESVGRESYHKYGVESGTQLTSYQKSRYFVSFSLEAQNEISALFTLILSIFLWEAKQPMLTGKEVFYFKSIRSEG